MKLLLSVISILTLSCTISASATAERLSFDKRTYDFGSVAQGKVVSHSFTFRNTGNSSATITRVGSSCGCTVANVAQRIILPGKTGEITASFDSSDFYGKVTKEVYIYMEDPQKPAYTLTMEGNVVEELVVTPRQISLGTVAAGVRNESVLKLENKGRTLVKIKEISTTLPQSTASSSKKVLKPGEALSITLSVIPKGDSRFINGYLTITMDGTDKKEKIVPVYGVVQK